MGDFLEVAKVLVDPVTKLFDMVGNAIGTVYEPHHVRKMADAEAYKIKTIGGAISDMAVLPASYNNGAILLDSTNTDDLLRRAEAREMQQKIREQKNIEKVLAHAQRELLTSPPVEDTPVDEDWMNRLINNAKEVSSETMQFIWGKILAGEVASPGRFSKRTLETIRNLSQHEASVFQSMLPYFLDVGDSLALLRSETIHKKYGIQYGDLLILDECGLMSTGRDILRNAEIREDYSYVLHNNSLVLFAVNIPARHGQIQFPIHKLTSAGNELYRILTSECNQEFFMDVAEELAAQHKEIQFKVHKINDISEDMVDYEEPAVKEYNTNT